MHILFDVLYSSKFQIFLPLPSPTDSEYICPCHRFEYQTPIKVTSLALFVLRHAVRGRWAAQGQASWSYWVKILMERSQSLWLCSQCLMLTFSKSHFGNTDMFIYLEMTEHEVRAHSQFHRVATRRWTTTASYWWPLNSSQGVVLCWVLCLRQVSPLHLSSNHTVEDPEEC